MAPSDPNGAGPGRLTPREAEVLRRYATGMSSGEVAADLGLTAGAVREHLRTAMAKLGACTKLEAIILAARSGQIIVPGGERLN